MRKPGLDSPSTLYSNRRNALGVDLDAHIGFCIEAMKKRAGELGL